MVILNDNGMAWVLLENGEMRLFLLPSLRNGQIQEAIEIIDRLPQGLYLAFDRQTGEGCILGTDDTGGPDLAEYLAGKARAALRARDDLGGKTTQAADNDPQTPLYQERRVKQYLVQETEISAISAAGGAANAYYALSTFTGGIAATIGITAAFTEKLPPEGVALYHYGVPILGVLALVFLIMGIAATVRSHSIWETIRREST
jgi:hypothetical protein